MEQVALHRETLARIGALLLRGGLRALDLVWASLTAPRLLVLDLRLLAWSFRWSPYRPAGFADHLRLRRLAGRGDDLTYGEMPWLTLRRLLAVANLHVGALFVDLGCGTGRALALASHGFGARCRGVEIVHERIATARMMLAPAQWPGVLLEEGDLRDADLSGADVVLLNWTCLSSESRRLTASLLAHVPAGCRVIALTHPLDGDAWELLTARRVWLSWGRGTAYVQVRRPPG